MQTDIETQEQNEKPSPKKEIGLIDAFWSIFSSMKTAIVLLLILAAVSITGTLITQNAPPEAYINAYGESKYHLLRNLGLTDVYHSGWYGFLLALIGVNLTVCSINRFKTAWQRTFHPTVPTKVDQIRNMQRSESIKCREAISEVADKVASTLRSGSFRVYSEQTGEEVSIYATKGRLAIWGPYFTHLSLLLIFAGAIFGGRMGFDGRTMIEEGSSVDKYFVMDADNQAEKTLGFSVQLLNFTIEHDKEHNPTAYKSDLQVFEGGKPVTQKTIDVNHPLTYKGVSFYQSSYGLSGLRLKIKAPNGETQTLPYNIESNDGPNGMEYSIPDNMLKQLKFGDKSLTVFVHSFEPDFVEEMNSSASGMPLHPAIQIMVNDRFPEYKGLDGWARLDWLPLSKSIQYKGFTISFADAPSYSVLQVASNPGLPVIYAGFGLILAGVFFSFYITHKRIRVVISPSDKGAIMNIGAASRSEPSTFDTDFERLRSLSERSIGVSE